MTTATFSCTQIRWISAAIPAWFGRSSESSGSSSSSSRGLRTRAWAISSRCCSPPEHSPIGRCAYAEAPTSSITSRTRSSAARRAVLKRRENGSGTPQRSPSSPSRTTSTPRIRSDASKFRRCGRYPICSPAAPGRCPSTLTLPAAAGSVPSRTLIIVDLPTPFGPSTATNSPGRTVRSTPLQSRRPPMETAASCSERTASSVISVPCRLGEGRLQAPQFADHPLLEAVADR